MDTWSGADGKLFQGRIEEETSYATTSDGVNLFAMSDGEEEEEEEEGEDSANNECDESDCCDGDRQRGREQQPGAKEKRRAEHPTVGGKKPFFMESTFQIAPRPPRRAELNRATTVISAEYKMPRVEGQKGISSNKEVFTRGHVNWAAITYDDDGNEYLVETLIDDKMNLHNIKKEVARIIWKKELKAAAGGETIPLKNIDEQKVDLEFRQLLPRDAKGRACLPAVGTQIWRARTRARLMKTEKKEMDRMEEACRADREASEDEGEEDADDYDAHSLPTVKRPVQRVAVQKPPEPRPQQKDKPRREKEKQKESRRKETKRKASPAPTKTSAPHAKKMRLDEADPQTTTTRRENDDPVAPGGKPERRLVVCSTPAARALSEQLKLVDDPRLADTKGELEKEVNDLQNVQDYLQNVAMNDINDLTALVFCAASLVRFETAGKQAPTRPDMLEAVARIFASGSARYSPEAASSLCPITVSEDGHAAMSWEWILKAMMLNSQETTGDVAVKDNPFDNVDWAKKGMLDGVTETLQDMGYPNPERTAKWIVVFLIYMFDLTKC